jgi:hypothetical protein
MTKAVREINEITIDEAKEIVARNVSRKGYEFVMLINKSAALFRNEEGRFGLVLGQSDGVQVAGHIEFSFITYREPVTYYNCTFAAD